MRSISKKKRKGKSGVTKKLRSAAAKKGWQTRREKAFLARELEQLRTLLEKEGKVLQTLRRQVVEEQRKVETIRKEFQKEQKRLSGMQTKLETIAKEVAPETHHLPFDKGTVAYYMDQAWRLYGAGPG